MLPLPPTAIAELADHPLLVSRFIDLRKGPADRMMKRFVGEHVYEDPPPGDPCREPVDLPEMDRGRAPVLKGIWIGGPEGDGEAEELFAFGPSNRLQFPWGGVGLSEIEDPCDSAVA